METSAIALEHIRFQLDLLRLTGTPLKLGGARAEALSPELVAPYFKETPHSENEVEHAMKELSVTASRLADYL